METDETAQVGLDAIEIIHRHGIKDELVEVSTVPSVIDRPTDESRPDTTLETLTEQETIEIISKEEFVPLVTDEEPISGADDETRVRSEQPEPVTDIHIEEIVAEEAECDLNSLNLSPMEQIPLWK